MFRLAVFAAALAVAPAAAFAGEGVCNLDASHIKRTYGFSAHGISDGNNPFAPAGDFVQSGTETNNPTTATRSTISGTWNVVLDQNDTSGVKTGVTFGGTFTVDRSTCAGDFYVTDVNNMPTPSMLAFHVIFVNLGSEVRTISLIPGLYVSYDTAKAL
jgi:hypothetical protein